MVHTALRKAVRVKDEQTNMAQERDANFRHILRICNTDLNGNHGTIQALRKIKGVNFMMANIACRVSGVNGAHTAGTLSDDNISKLNTYLKAPLANGAPSWIFNRKNEPEQG